MKILKLRENFKQLTSRLLLKMTLIGTMIQVKHPSGLHNKNLKQKHFNSLLTIKDIFLTELALLLSLENYPARLGIQSLA
jgi:hypothetical protein